MATAIKFLLQIVVFTTIVGCAATGDPASPPVDKSIVTFDGLHPAESEFFDRVYVADPLDVSGYTRILPQAQGGQYRHPAATNRETGEEIIISAENQARFQAQLASTVSNKLTQSEKFELASTPAANTLALWGSLVDINAYVEADGTDIVEFVLVLELRDSMSNTTLVRVIHPYQVPLDHNDPDRSWAELAAVLDAIALTIRGRLENVFGQYGHY